MFPSDGEVASSTGIAEAGFSRRARDYLYVWADGCISAGSHGGPQRMHAGADRGYAGGQEGTHRLPGWRSGKRAELARTSQCDVKRRGLKITPEIAVGDGALALEGARQVFPGTRHQRSGCIRLRTLLNKVALSVQANMKAGSAEITWRKAALWPR